MTLKIKIYQRPSGKAPFSEWFASLQDIRTKALINNRILRLATGHFGDIKAVGNGVFEMRVHYGPGYRIYFANKSSATVLLLSAGIKKTQALDIKKARDLLQEYEEYYEK